MSYDAWMIPDTASGSAGSASSSGSPERGNQNGREIDPVGAELLDDVEMFLSRFVVYPTKHERIAHALWIAHCWFMDCWESTPRIAFLSPEPASGKSRALEVTEPLVPRPVHAVNTTPSYLFRKVSDEAGPPTILYDEIDTVFGPRAKDNEDIRGMLNAGHRKGATAGRCVVRGNVISTEELPAYCAVALAGLDDLPDTLMTRSIVVRMRRRSPGERVEPWRLRINGPAAAELGDRLQAWSAEVQHRLGVSWPHMPEGIEDRNADIWEALLAVADLAGGHWPERARVTAVTLVTHSQGRGMSLGVLLLRDLRDVFAEANTDRLSTEALLNALTEIDESPWGDLRGKPLDARGLSRRLSKYDEELKPKVLRVGDTSVRGYEAAEFHDLWDRYLPPLSSSERCVTSVTSVATSLPATSVTDVTHPRQYERDAQVAHSQPAEPDGRVRTGWTDTPNQCRDCSTPIPAHQVVCVDCALDIARRARADVGIEAAS